MTGLRLATSTALASAVLALAATGCGDDEPASVATTPSSTPSATAPSATVTTPDGTTTTPPGSTTPSSTGRQGQSEEVGRYTLAINEVLRESSAFAVAVQACARGSKDDARSCVEKASGKLDSVDDKYGEAAEALGKDAPKACKDALGKSGDAVKALLDVLEQIGGAAAEADVKKFNSRAEEMGKALQGRSTDLVAAMTACAR